MNDRELLEMAAKAYFSDGPTHISGDGFMDWVRDCRGPFNPLTDDGDALRLGIKLMEFEPYKSRGILPCICDDVVKTRRAIVRSAAEIGKTMP